jgi:nucleoside-diphosphate-sugar epimerase
MTPPAKRALVTGATGYVGTKICERLVADGWRVDAVTRAHGRHLSSKLHGRVAVHDYDRTYDSLVQAIIAARPTVVFHLASLFVAEHRSEHVDELIESNVLFGTQLAEACVRNGVGLLVNTGTSWQHFRSGAYDPVCLYAATKQAFENVLDFYVDAFEFKAITLSLFDTYGPGDPRLKLVNLLLQNLDNNEPLLMSPGKQLLDLVHIDDVTNAFCVAASRLLMGASEANHERFSVSTSELISIQDLVALIRTTSGRRLDVVFGGRPYRRREVMKPLYATPWIPGWHPTISLRTGIAALFEKIT